MVAMIENYTFSEDAKINMDKRGIKTGYEKILFPLHFKPASNIEVVEQKFSLFENNSNFKHIKPALSGSLHQGDAVHNDSAIPSNQHVNITRCQTQATRWYPYRL